MVLMFSQYPHDADAQAFSDVLQREIDVWHALGGSYGYVFHLLTRAGSPASVDY
jgi:hypothetical protein